MINIFSRHTRACSAFALVSIAGWGLLIVDANAQEQDLGFFSMLHVELVCTAPTGPQAQSKLLNAQICGSDDFPFPDDFDLGDPLGCGDPFKEVRGLGNETIPCALAKARTDEFVVEICGNATGSTADNITTQDAGHRSATTSLVLPSGNILHQWSARCPIALIAPPE